MKFDFRTVSYWVMFALCLWTLVSGVYDKASRYDAFSKQVEESKACFDAHKAPVVVCYDNPNALFLINKTSSSSLGVCYA